MLTGRPGLSAAPGISGRGAPGRKPAGLLNVSGPSVSGLSVPGLNGSGTGASGPGALPVLPALRELLPRGLARGTVVAVAEFGLLCLALAAAASADGAWCGIAGLPEAGVLAAAGLGLDAGRILLVPDPGPVWPQVTASLLDGCELVLLRPLRPAGTSAGRPADASAGRPVGGQAPAQARRRLEATLRRGRGVLIVAGDWPGAQYRLRVVTQRWTGLGDGRGRLRACCAEITADGRGEAAMTRTRWLWLPGEDGSVALADPRDFPSDLPPGVPSGSPPAAQAGFPPGLPSAAQTGLPYGGSASPDEATPALRVSAGNAAVPALRAVGG